MKLETNLTKLPIQTFEIVIGFESKTLVNLFYREFTSGVTGLNTEQGQLERLDRMINH